MRTVVCSVVAIGHLVFSAMGANAGSVEAQFEAFLRTPPPAALGGAAGSPPDPAAPPSPDPAGPAPWPPVAAIIPRTPPSVAFRAAFPADAIVIVNSERALYLVLGNGRALRYPVAIGTPQEAWTGLEFVTDKKEHPPWFPVSAPGGPPREPVPGGDPRNPLGARALYLGTTLWRIHGTPSQWSIGMAVSNGCIRMLNEHVVDLYERVPLGTEVFVVDRLSDTPPVLPGAKTN